MKKALGRPRKKSSERVEYQLIAVYRTDYDKYIRLANAEKKKKVELFRDMVEDRLAKR